MRTIESISGCETDLNYAIPYKTLCNNPHCINPEHLTDRCHSGHLLNSATLYYLKGYPTCRKCQLIACQNYHDRKRIAAGKPIPKRQTDSE